MGLCIFYLKGKNMKKVIELHRAGYRDEEIIKILMGKKTENLEDEFKFRVYAFVNRYFNEINSEVYEAVFQSQGSSLDEYIQYPSLESKAIEWFESESPDIEEDRDNFEYEEDFANYLARFYETDLQRYVDEEISYPDNFIYEVKSQYNMPFFDKALKLGFVEISKFEDYFNNSLYIPEIYYSAYWVNYWIPLFYAVYPNEKAYFKSVNPETMMW